LRALGAFLGAIAISWCAVVQAAEPLRAPKGPVLLTVSGSIAHTNAPGEARFDREMLDALGNATIRTKTPWTEGVQTFAGVPLRVLLDRVGARGTKLDAFALDDYKVFIPLEDLKYDLLLAMHLNGQVMTTRDKGPLWIVYPRDDHQELMDSRYQHRWVWQLKRLHVE
jgi:hypothetical protein